MTIQEMAQGGAGSVPVPSVDASATTGTGSTAPDARVTRAWLKYAAENPSKVLWSGWLGAGGVLLLVFFAHLDFLPDIDLGSSPALLAAVALIGVMVMTFLARSSFCRALQPGTCAMNLCRHRVSSEIALGFSSILKSKTSNPLARKVSISARAMRLSTPATSSPKSCFSEKSRSIDARAPTWCTSAIALPPLSTSCSSKMSSENIAWTAQTLILSSSVRAVVSALFFKRVSPHSSQAKG